MNRNTLFTAFFLLILASTGFVWYRYLQTPPQVESTTGTEQERFVRTLAQVRRLQGIDIDTSLFQDRFFRELAPPKEIPQAEVKPGRENPFAPFR